ncbi:MAG TPA: ABC transporter permease, partial [Allosphingosinicella sp.]
MYRPADFTQTLEGDTSVVRFTGGMTIAGIDGLPERLDQIHGERLILDLSNVERMDTVGAWLVHRLARDRDARLVGVGHDEAVLLEQVGQADQPVKMRPDRRPPLYRVMDEVGEATALAAGTMLGLLGFFGELLVSAWNVATHPRRFRFNAVVQ